MIDGFISTWVQNYGGMEIVGSKGGMKVKNLFTVGLPTFMSPF